MGDKSNKSRDKYVKPQKIDWEEHLDMLSFKIKPVSETYLERLGQEMVAWAINNEDALKVSQFFTAKGIHQTTAQRWRMRSKTFGDAFSFAKQVIGDRREIGGLKRKYDSGMVTTTMCHYDQEWKEIAEWRAKIKAEADTPPVEAKVVVIERFPDSPLVPVIKKDTE